MGERALLAPSFRGAARAASWGAQLRTRESRDSGFASSMRAGMTRLTQLRRPDVGQERVDLFAQYVGLAAQRAGGGQHLGGGGSGLRRGAGDTDDVGGNLAGAAGGVLN